MGRGSQCARGPTRLRPVGTARRVEFGWDRHRGHDGPMALDGVQRDEAADMLRRVLAAVDRGELTTDGPAAAATVRRLEGALLALESIGDAASGTGYTPS